MYCQACGTENAAGAATCTKCGHPLVGVPTAAAVAASHDLYAGFWPRLAALILDSLLLYAVMFALGLALELAAPQGLVADGSLDLLFLLVAWLYFAVTQSSARQASPGQRVMSLKVTDLAGRRIGFGRATGRYFASFLSSLLLLFGYLMNLFTARRQTLHDKIAGTLVLRGNATIDDLAATPVAPRTSGGRIAAVLLVCAIPVAGILAAIAIPAYQDYTIRSQVHEGLSQLGPVKAAIAEQVASGVPLEEISLASLGQAGAVSSKFVRDLTVEEGAIRITLGGDANPKIRGTTLSLIPAISDEGNLEWDCDVASVPEKYLPRACR